MKKLIFILIIFNLSLSLFSQTTTMNIAEGEFYKVYSEISLSHAQETSKKLDKYFELFNSYFHFDSKVLDKKLKVRIFANKDNFDNYLIKIISETRDSFVYLQYTDPQKSELLGYWGNEINFDSFLIHHGFIQFFKSFINNPPLWLQKGFAIFFEKSSYNPETNIAVYKDNLSWTKTLKDLISKENSKPGSYLISYPSFLTMDISSANTKINTFYAQSWGLIYFLINTQNKEYNRILWDSINTLNPNSSLENNEISVIQKAFYWTKKDKFISDFTDFILLIKTFPDLVQDGLNYYATNQIDDAEKAFTLAVSLKNDHPISYYYLGLINYKKKEYSMAEYYYQTALQMGEDPGITYYALGVNSFADSKLDDARVYLQQANEADPLGYGEKALQLLKQIEDEQPAVGKQPAD